MIGDMISNIVRSDGFGSVLFLASLSSVALVLMHKKQNQLKRKKKYRFIALDLDGTTLNSQHEMSSLTIKTLQSLNRRGLQICIATGRSTPSVLAKLKMLQLERPVPVVCFNGACGRRVSSDLSVTKLFDSGLDMASARMLLAIAEELNIVAQYYLAQTGEIYACPKNEEHHSLLRQYASLTGKSAIISSYEEVLAIAPPAKILFMTNHADELIAQMKERLPRDQFHLIRGSPDPFFVEFLASGTNKGTGLVKLCSQLNVPLDEVVAFGDGENDAEFLQYAGLGLAVRNAKALAKQSANEVLPWSNDEDAVAKKLMQLEEEGLLLFD